MSRRKTSILPGKNPSRTRRARLLPPTNGQHLATGSSVKKATIDRLGLALKDIIDASSEPELLEALSKRTAIDALIDLMSRNSTALEAAVHSPDPLRAARGRAVQTMADLAKAEGGPLGVEDVAKRLGIGRAAVDKRRKNDQLLGIQDGSRPVRYPSWQFTATGVLVGIPETLSAIGVKDPWMRMQFFLSEDKDLGATPLGALRQGKIAEVQAAAARFGRQGDDA